MTDVLKYFLSPAAKSRGVRFSPPRSLDAGFDLPAAVHAVIPSGTQAAVPTGLHLAIPEGWVGLVRDRSSVAKRGGVTVAGVIDSSYRGEVKVLLYNLSREPLDIVLGERIAQCVIVPHFVPAALEEVLSLEDLGLTERSSGGFGSTGR